MSEPAVPGDLWPELVENQPLRATDFGATSGGHHAEIRTDHGDDVVGALRHVLVRERHDPPPGEPEPRRPLGTGLPVAPRRVGAVAIQLDDQPRLVPKQVDTGDAATALA